MPVPESTFLHADVRLTWGAATERGKVRRLNEDSMLAAPGLFLVADGMGGHAAGDIASRIVVETCRQFVDSIPLAIGSLESMIAKANTEAFDYGRANGLVGMGTTLVGLAAVSNGGVYDLAVINVGDSRCYELPAEGVLALLTRDHSVVQELIDAGSLSASAAGTHEERGVITRALGIADHVAADFLIVDRRRSTRLLLCSDGVSGELSDVVIGRILAESPSADAAADAIIEAVLRTPARDNATAVVVDVERADNFRPEADGASTTQPPVGVGDREAAESSSVRIDRVPRGWSGCAAARPRENATPLIREVPRDE